MAIFRQLVVPAALAYGRFVAKQSVGGWLADGAHGSGGTGLDHHCCFGLHSIDGVVVLAIVEVGRTD